MIPIPVSMETVPIWPMALSVVVNLDGPAECATQVGHRIKSARAKFHNITYSLDIIHDLFILRLPKIIFSPNTNHSPLIRPG